jgi:formate C-acetyltransferase
MEHNRFYIFPGVQNMQNRVSAEFERYYSTFDSCSEELVKKLDSYMTDLETEFSYEKKTAMHELLCRECPVHLFRESPFFFEISSGRPRYSWGGYASPVGRYLQLKTKELWETPYVKAVEQDQKDGFFQGWSPFGIDHHCAGYDKILSIGLLGIIRQAEDQLEACDDPRKQAFYRCVIRSNQALIGLAQRFAAEANRLVSAA